MPRKVATISVIVPFAVVIALGGCDDEDELDDVDTGERPAAEGDTAIDGEVGPAPDAPETGTAVREVDCGEVDPDVSVSVIEFDYEPVMASVDAGRVVEWTNDGDVAHTTTSGAPGGDSIGNIWDSGTMNPGDTFCVEFREAGTYPYFCTIHPQRMQATMAIQ